MGRSMTQRVLILLPGVGVLALEEEAYRRALEEGLKFAVVFKPQSINVRNREG